MSLVSLVSPRRLIMSAKPIKPKFDAIIRRNGEVRATTTVTGRVAWALLSLMRGGETGCTPITRPAPRWSDYVFRLRGQGFDVETIDESHGGSFAGSHARYVLRDQVSVFGGNLREYLDSPEGRREFGNAYFGSAAA
jgi:hypothetical protein